MNTVTLQEAESRLAELIDKAAADESFVISRAGRPLVKITPCEGHTAPERLGFLRGRGVATAPVKEKGCS